MLCHIAIVAAFLPVSLGLKRASSSSLPTGTDLLEKESQEKFSPIARALLDQLVPEKEACACTVEHWSKSKFAFCREAAVKSTKAISFGWHPEQYSWHHYVSGKYELTPQMYECSPPSNLNNANFKYHLSSGKCLAGFDWKLDDKSEFVTLQSLLKMEAEKSALRDSILLRMDIEGQEYETLTKLPASWFEAFSGLHVDYHFSFPVFAPNSTQLDNFLLALKAMSHVNKYMTLIDARASHWTNGTVDGSPFPTSITASYAPRSVC